MPYRQPNPNTLQADLLKRISEATEMRAQLTEERRRLVLEANESGLSMRQLSELLNVPLGTASGWVREARRSQ
ncbi:hypothetical protein [Frondihabitans sp. PhB188]|uniref:hypothetical protein n=1 Tax=Frondihabitans sp. PhB188 TaxID=2485200 RepID=UPI0011CD72CE|nr:hypothetical protein [Frondihabitans sp. PhB188]